MRLPPYNYGVQYRTRCCRCACGFWRFKSSMTLYGDGNKIVTLSASYNFGNAIAFFAFCPFYSLANSRCFISVYLSSCLLFRLSRFGSPTTAWTRINTRGLKTCILSPNHIQMMWGLEQGLEQGKFFFFHLG